MELCYYRQPHGPHGKIVGREIVVLGSDRVVVQDLLVMKTK